MKGFADHTSQAATTFSTFTLDTIQLLQNRQFGYAGLYLFSSILLCIAMSAFGIVVARGIEQFQINKGAGEDTINGTEM